MTVIHQSNHEQGRSQITSSSLSSYHSLILSSSHPSYPGQDPEIDTSTERTLSAEYGSALICARLTNSASCVLVYISTV